MRQNIELSVGADMTESQAGVMVTAMETSETHRKINVKFCSKETENKLINYQEGDWKGI